MTSVFNIDYIVKQDSYTMKKHSFILQGSVFSVKYVILFVNEQSLIWNR